MIFQLLSQNFEWYQFIINLLIVVIGRSLDLISTRIVTRELKLETNKLAKRLGWRGMIFIQIPILILGLLDFYLAFFIFIWSLLLFCNNLQSFWYIKEIGEENYLEELKIQLKNSKIWKIILSELTSFVSFSITGILILIFLFLLQDLIAVFFICLSLICQGFLGSLRSMKFLLELKNEKDK